MKRGLNFGIFVLIFIVFLIGFVEGGLWEDIFSPFDASVTIAGNRPPVIEDIGNDVFICENQSLLEYFNVSDVDGNQLFIDINPKFPFFVSPTLTTAGVIKTQANIFSAGLLLKNNVDQNLGYRIYAETLSASDGRLIATKQVNINVIEINNPPVLSDIGVQTVWTHGDDSTFYYQARAVDVEEGNQDAENLEFRLSFLDGASTLFGIAANGTMIFSPNIDDIDSGLYDLGVYNIELCVKDKGITPVHPKIVEECGHDGSAMEICDIFSLTITNENRAPQITDYFPRSLLVNASGNDQILFNASFRDPDGTIPDVYWYFNGVNVGYKSMVSFDEYLHSVPCGIANNYTVRVDVSDGLLNTSLIWDVNVSYVACPVNPPSGGGGGGGGGGGLGSSCKEKWGCLDWGICQDAQSSFNSRLLAEDDFKVIKQTCSDKFIDTNLCGFQIRNCIDVNACNTSVFRPDEKDSCLVVSNPSCTDQVTNCHDGSCELLVDCGGPCDACATCSDGKRNQGERGIDCEGPCPNICPPKPPLLERLKAMYTLIILIIAVIIIILIFVIRAYRAHKKIKMYEE